MPRYSLLPEQVVHAAQMKPGDVIACCGTSTLCRLIQWFSGSPYSHTAIVYDVQKDGDKVKIMLAESTCDALTEDDKTPTRFSRGVQMHWLHKYLDCDIGVWWAPLKEPLSPDELRSMRVYIDEVYDTFTDFDWPGILGVGLELITGLELFDQPDFRRLFCSEFVTNSLVQSGRVSKDVNPSKQTPGSVVTSDCFHKAIQLK